MLQQGSSNLPSAFSDVIIGVLSVVLASFSLLDAYLQYRRREKPRDLETGGATMRMDDISLSHGK
jgi:hypothetical protein